MKPFSFPKVKMSLGPGDINLSQPTGSELESTTLGHPEMEEDIRKLCAEVLGRSISRVKLERSFVAQGGDSLMAIKLMARCRAKGYTINVQDLLQSASIREFCQCVKPSQTSETVAGNASAHTISHENLHDAAPDPPSVDIPITEVDTSRLSLVTPNPNDGIELIFPCSPTQEVFLAAQAVHPEKYHVTAVLEFSSNKSNMPVDAKRLSEAWEQLVKYHAALRTVFIDSMTRPGHFDQVVFKTAITKLHILDDRACSPEEFSLRTPVAFPNYQATHNAAIHRHPNQQTILFRLDISHALADGESISILLRDLQVFYFHPARSLPPQMQYQTFVSHQQSLSSTAATSYWSTYLTQAEPSFFPVRDQAEISTGTDLTASVPLRISIDPEALSTLCEKLNITTANICQLAWGLVLRAYTASEDVCFSYANSGRHVPLGGIENAVGSFADTLIFRMRIGSDEMTVGDALAVAKGDFLKGLGVPSGLLVMDTSEAGGAAAREFARCRGNTLLSCQRGWDLGNGDSGENSGFGVRLVDAVNPNEVCICFLFRRRERLQEWTLTGILQYDLSLNIEIRPGCLVLAIDFWRSRIAASTVESVAQGFQKAVTCILASEGTTSLASIDVVPESQIAQLRAWNHSVPPALQVLLQDGFKNQCISNPNAKAIQGWDGDLTYRELDALSDKLAFHLADRLGVGPKTKVPLCFAKSKWAIVAQLAVLKAGGCLVPLGMNQPPQRTSMILQDIRATILLADTQNALSFASFPSLQHILPITTSFITSLPSPSGCAVSCPSTPRDPAFIIYTSGSTGIPKGVVLPHKSLATSIHHLSLSFCLSPQTRTAQFSAYTFDISIQDIYTTLSVGGCLVILSEEDRVANLASAMVKHTVNTVGLTSTVAGLLSPDQVPCLSTLVLLGEAVKPAVVETWLPHVDAVYNAYGPSECSMQVSVNRFASPADDALNIGHVTAGALWVVDANHVGRLVPVGAPGELLIEGPLLAEGYLGDPVKTEQAFVDVGKLGWPVRYLGDIGFGEDQERRMGRMYRTGDLVRQNADGSITYIGRRDTQIKVRGQRVEVGEMEHHLVQHNEVLDAAVVFPRKGVCKDRLVGLVTLRAWFLAGGKNKLDLVVPVAPGEITAAARKQLAEVADYLTTRVPEHMVPKVWIPLASMMPQNVSGKLDRKRLGIWAEEMGRDIYEAMSGSVLCGGGVEAETGTAAEEQMRAIWAAVLKVTPAGIPLRGSSFLACGGDSIAAMQIIAQCRAQGISFGVRDVLQSKSVAQLVSVAQQGLTDMVRVDVMTRSGLTPEVVDTLNKMLPNLGLHLDAIEDIYPCSPMQQGILVSQAKSPSSYLIQQSFEIRSTQGTTPNPDRLAKAWQMLIDRHAILRTVFVPAVLPYAGNSLFDQLVLKSYTGGIEHVHCQDEETHSHLAIQSNVSFSSSIGSPSHELTIYSTPSSHVYIRLVINHALVDASSLNILQTELLHAYDGTIVTTSPVPQYNTYISYLHQTPPDTSLQYWAAHLENAEPCHLPVLTDTGFPLSSNSQGEEVQIRQPLEITTTTLTDPVFTTQFRALATIHGITPATIFQLAWALVLSQYTGTQDISFGYLTSGRDVPVPGVDNLVGLLINLLVTRVRIEDPATTTVIQALKQTQERFLDGFGHQRVSLAEVFHALGVDSGHGLFNTSLSYRHAPFAGDEDADSGSGRSLTLEMITVEDPTEYDVNVNVFSSGPGSGRGEGRELTIMLQYSPDFMSAATAEGVLGRLVQTVDEIAKSPMATLSEVVAASVFSGRMDTLSRGTTIPAEGYDVGERDCIHELVHRQRTSTPDSKAVHAWDGDMSYAELEDAADRIASHLITDMGVGPEKMVALCFEKSRWAIVAQLAGRFPPFFTLGIYLN